MKLHLTHFVINNRNRNNFLNKILMFRLLIFFFLNKIPLHIWGVMQCIGIPDNKVSLGCVSQSEV